MSFVDKYFFSRLTEAVTNKQSLSYKTVQTLPVNEITIKPIKRAKREEKSWKKEAKQ